jgi:hypothetical protein
MRNTLTAALFLWPQFSLLKAQLAGKWKTIDDQTEKQNLLLKYMKKEKYMVK